MSANVATNRKRGIPGGRRRDPQVPLCDICYEYCLTDDEEHVFGSFHSTARCCRFEMTVQPSYLLRGYGIFEPKRGKFSIEQRKHLVATVRMAG